MLFIKDYVNSLKVKIMFIDTGYTTNTNKKAILKGSVKDKMKPIYYGVGFIGEGGYKTGTKGYYVWKGILDRCYNKSLQNTLKPTYKGCYVCNEWLNFQNFSRWYDDNSIEGYQVDKDLLYLGNKKYSPIKCIMLPNYINNFLSDNSANRGKYKIGVTRPRGRGKYLASVNHEGRTKYLGSYNTELEAFNTWLSFKLNKAKEYKTFLDSLDKRLYQNIIITLKSY